MEVADTSAAMEAADSGEGELEDSWLCFKEK